MGKCLATFEPSLAERLRRERSLTYEFRPELVARPNEQIKEARPGKEIAPPRFQRRRASDRRPIAPVPRSSR